LRLAFFQRAIGWIRGLFRREPPSVESVVLDFPAPPRARPGKKKRESRKDAESGGGFYFRGAILDHLDDYFTYIRRMRRSDPDAYDMLSKVGASLLPPGIEVATDLSPWWKAGNRPSFGAVGMALMEGVDDKANFYPKFMYFRKWDRPPATVEPTNGTVYEVVSYLDQKDDKVLSKLRRGYPITIYVSVDRKGNLKALKEHHTKRVLIKSKRGDFAIPHRDWFESHAIEWAKQKNREPQEFVDTLFALLTSAFEQTNSHIRVAVSKGAETAMFGIDVKRTPYFFSDREMALNANGSKARIFHIVRAHKRTYAGGSEKFIKFHFRGLRDFDWNGYRVHISMPGLHHSPLIEFEGGGHDIDETIVTPGMIEFSEVGNILQKHLSQ
jgi:hypothetical protein